jgi:molybdate transport system substrate-binding protein
MRLPRIRLAGALVVVVVTAACSSSSPAAKPSTPSAGNVTGAVTVSAASSLSAAFTELGTDFRTAHPEASVTFNFGSSATLATQIRQGAPADVFASADATNAATLAAAGLTAGAPRVFARNQLEIVTKPGNPKRVKGLADLARLGVVSLCAETVPCGKYAAQALATAGVTIPAAKVTRGPDASATLAAVATGDADAAVAYVTDAERAAATVAAVPIPDAQNVLATYPIVVLKAAAGSAAARAFVAYVLSGPGQATLRRFGFLAPR